MSMLINAVKEIKNGIGTQGLTQGVSNGSTQFSKTILMKKFGS